MSTICEEMPKNMERKPVIVVEASGFYLKQLKTMLPKDQFSLYAVSSYQQAKQVIDKGSNAKKIWFCIADYALPDGVDGQIIELCNNHGIPVMAIVSDSSQMRKRMTTLGVVDYIISGSNQGADYIKYVLMLTGSIRHQRALIVNDSKMQTFLLTKFLMQLGFAVVVCDSGEKAIEILNNNKEIILVLTDYILPKMTGLDLIQRIRHDRNYDNTIVMVMTGTVSDDLYAMVFKAGADDILTKPFRKEEFNRRILREIELYHAKNKYRDLVPRKSVK